eukprot:scaffold97969_cov33-Cyclotella_meneghiniana.AAC.1
MARDDDSSPTGTTGAMQARETRQTTQQSIGMRARARGGGANNDKFIHLGQSSRPPSPENKHNNQPDRWREAESNKEGGWWGEEGGISSNTTHNNHRR